MLYDETRETNFKLKIYGNEKEIQKTKCTQTKKRKITREAKGEQRV